MDEALPGTKPAHDPALAPHGVRGVIASVLKYLEARGVILTIEAQEAIQQILRLLIALVLGGIIAFTGWMLAIAVVVSLLVDRLAWSWEKAAGVVGGAHLLVAVILFSAVASRISAARWFTDTINEFKKDRAWVANQTDRR